MIVTVYQNKKYMTGETDCEDNIIDIFAKIDRGLKTDYLDSKTNQIWKVENYVLGKTRGVDVYTAYGRYLGTAHRGRFVRDPDGTDTLYVRKADTVSSYNDLTSAIIEQSIEDYETHMENFLNLYHQKRAVRAYVDAVIKKNEVQKEYDDISKINTDSYDDYEKWKHDCIVKLVHKHLEQEKEHVHMIRMSSATAINKFIKSVSELKKLYSFFEKGHANALVDGEQDVINEAVRGLEKRTGFIRFLKNNPKFKKKEWF